MEDNDIFIDNDYFSDLKRYVSKNYFISDFYRDLYNETGDFSFFNRAGYIDSCCKWWDVDYYRMQAVKDIKRVNLCHDKFCFNCQSMLAIKRQAKFAPVLDDFRSDYMVCHLVMTVPNCSAFELKPLLDKMYRRFPQLMRYFKGDKKISGINFMKYGYRGCVRGLEVTYNNQSHEFHPHFHCMIIFRRDLDLSKRNVNSFSFDDGHFNRYFSDLEILIQKIWYLLMNDIRVNLSAINQLPEGYSCILDDSEGYYHECFKYACKGAFDESKGAFLYNELVFKTLFYALKNRRMIQGYGCLHNFNDLDGDIIEDEVSLEYAQIISKLRVIEDPLFCIDSLDEIIDQSFNCRYISKSNLKRLIIERRRDPHD